MCNQSNYFPSIRSVQLLFSSIVQAAGMHCPRLPASTAELSRPNYDWSFYQPVKIKPSQKIRESLNFLEV